MIGYRTKDPRGGSSPPKSTPMVLSHHDIYPVGVGHCETRAIRRRRGPTGPYPQLKIRYVQLLVSVLDFGFTLLTKHGLSIKFMINIYICHRLITTP